MADIRPYRSTPVFDQDTLPAALRARHDTKAGVWGLIRVIEGELNRPASEAYVARMTDRPAFRKAHADQMAHFAAADAKREEVSHG